MDEPDHSKAPQLLYALCRALERIEVLERTLTYVDWSEVKVNQGDFIEWWQLSKARVRLLRRNQVLHRFNSKGPTQ